MIKIIIFDFDGTIADTHSALIEITNQLASDFGYEPISLTLVSELKNLSSRQIIKQSKIPLLKIPFLLKRVKQELGKQINNLKPFLGINPHLYSLQHQGYRLGIITSNSETNVLNFLKSNNLDDLFDFVYSETSLFGKHKTIAKFLERHSLKAEEVIYVGDEIRDIEAAHNSGIKVIAVTWGFNSRESLAKHQPDYLIEHPQDLLPLMATVEQNLLAN